MGSDVVDQFLAGMKHMDDHFLNESDFTKNIPTMLGLIDFYHINIQALHVKALIPYCEPLKQFVGHIAQLEMESNGKFVQREPSGQEINYTGGIVFGDTGSNCQHSFFQLIHQGRIVPIEFIAFMNSSMDNKLEGHSVSNHDELVLNYLAQVRALTYGRSPQEMKDLKVPDDLIPHCMFEGNRPNTSLLFPALTIHSVGQLYSIYENRTAVEGWLSRVNSFDQYGVELGKQLCSKFRSSLISGGEELQKDAAIGNNVKFFLQHRKS
jgi:glucose-6-phosphate isomerase